MQDAAQQGGIGLQHQLRGQDRQTQPLRLRLRLEVLPDLVEQRVQADGAALDAQQVRIHAGHVQQAVQQTIQAGQDGLLALRNVQHVFRAGVALLGAAGQDVGKQAQSVNRLAQVVPGGRQVARLGLVGGGHAVALR
ncbi:hypothetical protein G6F62_014084 [Rhizopus arrhizus]|nr:hypothetical protein G6F62_014084 [Rhizopus arrhizus]